MKKERMILGSSDYYLVVLAVHVLLVFAGSR
jgi:hypothetical protein